MTCQGTGGTHDGHHLFLTGVLYFEGNYAVKPNFVMVSERLWTPYRTYRTVVWRPYRSAEPQPG